MSQSLRAWTLAALLGCWWAGTSGCQSNDSGAQPESAPNGASAAEKPEQTPPVAGPNRVATSPALIIPDSENETPRIVTDPPTTPKTTVPAAAPAATTPEPLFQNWPQPLVLLTITGRQHGYIEPCGCTGLDRQKGGLARRHTFLNQLQQERGWTVVPLDAGNQVRRFGRQAEIKFQVTVDALKRMNYRAVGFGPDDLHLSIDELAATTAQIGDELTPFVSANTAILDREFTPRVRIIEVAGKRIGVTTVLGDTAREKLQVDEILTEDAVTSVRAAWQQLSESNCNYYVLLAQADRDESIALAQAAPKFDLVITTGGGDEPSYELESIPGTQARLVQVGNKGMYVAAVGLFDDPQTPWRYERIPLDARFGDSQEMLDVMANYQQQLERLGLEGLGIRPIPHPSGRTYVGSQACADCHSKATAVWQDTPHAKATDSLVHPGERVHIPRHYDPECLSCHVTGWDPQRYVPFTSGYASLTETPLMVGNGCENCHGPGSAHVAAELGDVEADEATKAMLRGEMRLPLAEAEKKCLECHDLDNSPDFHTPGAFEEYWRRIVHVGKD